jgi:cytochrome c-type biogenesis protein CcmE
MQDDREATLAMKRRRRRAKRVTMLLALVCAVVALALGAFQLQAEGLNQFLYRAPGVGASK